MAEKEQVSPKIVETMEHLMTEKEEMAGILECPAKQQRASNRLANNRFAALSEEEEVDHGDRPTMTDMYATTEARDNQTMRATNRHVTNNYNNIMANRTMMNDNDDMSVGTTQSADTEKRSNCSNIMPTTRSMMTRGAAWNVIRERNWVQQIIADRNRR